MEHLTALTETAKQAASAVTIALDHDTVEVRRERVLAYGRAILAIRNVIKADRAFHTHLKANGLDVRDRPFRASAMWLAREWDGVANSLHLCPYSNPNDIRGWFRHQEKAAVTMAEQIADPPPEVEPKAREKRPEGATRRYGASAACIVRDWLYCGQPITDLEAMTLCGASGSTLTAEVERLRRQGHKIEARMVPFLTAVTRVNRTAILVPPPQTAMYLDQHTLVEYRMALTEEKRAEIRREAEEPKTVYTIKIADDANDVMKLITLAAELQKAKTRIAELEANAALI